METIQTVSYKAVDGTVFESKFDCECHERELKRKEVFRNAVNIHLPFVDWVNGMTECFAVKLETESDYNALAEWIADESCADSIVPPESYPTKAVLIYDETWASLCYDCADIASKIIKSAVVLAEF